MQRSKNGLATAIAAPRDQWFCCAKITGAQERLNDLTSYFTKMIWAFIVLSPRNVLGRPSMTGAEDLGLVKTSSKPRGLDEGD